MKQSPGIISVQYFQSSFMYMPFSPQIEVLTYNWAGELSSTLERSFQRVVQWHNARSALLTSILSQKMGLFQHNMFRGSVGETGQQSQVRYRGMMMMMMIMMMMMKWYASIYKENVYREFSA